MGRYGSLWDTFLHLWDKRPNVPNPCKGLGWDGLWDGTEWALKQGLKQGLNGTLE